MRILIYDDENVKQPIVVSLSDDGYFFCPRCKKIIVKLEKEHYNAYDDSKYTECGRCPKCNHKYYKGLN